MVRDPWPIPWRWNASGVLTATTDGKTLRDALTLYADEFGDRAGAREGACGSSNVTPRPC